jgi:hypothetical protein
MRRLSALVIGPALLAAGVSRAEDPAEVRPIPVTRDTMKQMLDDLKDRTPRIPLPPLTEEEKATYGERGPTYEARLRYHYMPGGDSRGSVAGREADPNQSLDYAFRTELFWIVSRTNNCHY